MQNEDFFAQLKASTDNLFKTLEEVSEGQSKYRPAEGKWTILECAEHVFITEIIVVQLLLQSTETSQADAAEAQERMGKARITQIIEDRSQRYTAPEMTEPKGEIESLEFFKRVFLSSREQLEAAFRDGKLNFNSSKTVKHPKMGHFTVLDWMNFLISHTERHRQQIEELKVLSN